MAKKRTEATAEDVKFLQERGYKVETVEDAQKFIDDLSDKDYAGYLKDKESPDDEEEGRGKGKKKLTIQLLHPITHDHTEYGRGLHELDADLAKLFLSFKDPVSRQPIAITPETKEAPKGTTARSADAPEVVGDPEAARAALAAKKK